MGENLFSRSLRMEAWSSFTMVQLQAKRVKGLGDRAMDKQKGKSFWARHPIFTGLLIFFVAPLPFVPFVDDTSVDGNSGQKVDAEQSNGKPTAAERREEAEREFEQRALSHVIDVIEQDRLSHMKRSILVELDQEVSMAELEVIGRMLQAQEPSFERTFIEYLLPGMQAGSGAWATTHFDPDLKVVLSGFSPNRPAQGAQPTATQTITGIWKVQADGYVITILKEGNKSILARTYSDGDETRDPVRERQTLLGARYDFSEGSDNGDHFIILKNGNLEARDDLGQIFVVRPLQN
ncbi:MAG TPA: hypothetical protein EYO33_03435 [Phycisphaerales bacterium]|nr:hypothetical protein [Phycisphaerales bacterium]